ncbi:hypothetical protein BZA77DRAFT_349433 [Pyronema omphalodes]|nr:hypothetical protein BZA77DRAFT_349433 [Pyronema omphalodes]
MALSGLDSLQSLSDALEQYLLTRSPAAKKYYDSIDRSNRKTRDDPEREIIKKRISGRRTEKAKWGAGCTTRYQSADEEFGHLRWERDETPHGSDSEPDEKEDDEQLRVLLGYVRPPEDDNYDDIPKLEYDEEDEEAEIYENYDSGNEGDDEDERLHKKGRWAVLCGTMEGLICAPETSTGPVTTGTTPGASSSTGVAPVHNVSAPQDSGISGNSSPPAISPVFGSSLVSTGQNHDSTASQQPFTDYLNSQFGFIIARSEQAIPDPIPTFPPMENLAVPTSAVEIGTHIPTLPPMENIPLTSCTMGTGNPTPTFPPFENLPTTTSATETGNPVTTFSTMENLPFPTSNTATVNPISNFSPIGNLTVQTFTTVVASPISNFHSTENLPFPSLTIDTINHIPSFTTMQNLPPPTSAMETGSPISIFPPMENISLPTAASEPSIITNTFLSSSNTTSSENATEPSAISIAETNFDTSPGPMASPAIPIDPSAAAATVAAQDLLHTNPAPNSPPQIVSSIPQETHFTSTPITTQATKAIGAVPSPSISIIPSAAKNSVAVQDALSTIPALSNPSHIISSIPQKTPFTSTPLTVDATAVTEVISTSTPAPRATSLNPNPNLETQHIPRRHRIPSLRPSLTPTSHLYRDPKALTEEDKFCRAGLEIGSQEDDGGHLSGKRKRGDQNTGMGKIDVRPAKRINGGMQKNPRDERRPDRIASRGNLKRVRWDENVTDEDQGARARKRVNTGRDDSRQDVTKPDGMATRSTLKRVRRDDNATVYMEGTRAPKRANTGREETRRDVASEEEPVSRGGLKKVRWDDDSQNYQASTGALKRLNSPGKEGRRGNAEKLDEIRGRGILKRKREEEVEEVAKNHIARSMVDTRAPKRPNLREEETWGLLKMVVKTVRSGWRFVVGLKNRIWR